MRNPLKNFIYEMGDSFRQVRGNALVIVLSQPIWAITNNLYAPYLTLYMNQIGCTYEQIGIINAVSMIFGTVIAVFAGWLTDRLGRRRTCLVADLICWVLACLLWGLAQNFVWFLIAGLASSFVRLITVSWNCTVAEGTPPEKRLNVYWWLNIVGTLAILATPVMSLFMDKSNPASLVPLMRTVLLGSSAILFITFIIRNYYLKELPIGLERMEASWHESPLAALKGYIPMFRLLRGNRLLLLFIAIRALYFIQIGLKGTYLPITVVKGLGFANDSIGIINLITGVVMLLAQFILLPKLRSLPPARTLLFSMSALILGTMLLALSPAGSMAILVASTFITAVGTLATGMLVDSSMANAMPDADRAPLLAFMTIITVALSAPFMWAGGWLAEIPVIGPRLPMGLLALLIGTCMVLVVMTGRMQRKVKLDSGVSVAG